MSECTFEFVSLPHFYIAFFSFLRFSIPVSFLSCILISRVEFQRDNNGRKLDVISLIGKKRDGLTLEDDEIEYLVNAVSRDTIDHFQIGEYIISQLLCCHDGMHD